jgi:hypothetical protein
LAAIVVGTVGLTLLLFLAGTTSWLILESNAIEWELKAEALEAVLAETQR